MTIVQTDQLLRQNRFSFLGELKEKKKNSQIEFVQSLYILSILFIHRFSVFNGAQYTSRARYVSTYYSLPCDSV